MQTEFRGKIRPVVDIIRFDIGNINEGNTAICIFFSNPAWLAEIMGADKDVIQCYGVILNTINSGYEI